MDPDHVIAIDKEVELMTTQMETTPTLLNKLDGKESCCIFRVPKSLAEINNEAYEPRIVSIGPYHYNNGNLDMIQEHKWRFLKDMITRTGKPLVTFLNLIVSMEDQIRASYSESIDHFKTNDLAKMMVLDGIFLIELFRKVGKSILKKHDDPIFRMTWAFPFLMRDLLRIENQIPFFVLQKLFDESKADDAPTLPSLILEFFNYSVRRPTRLLREYENLEGKHLLDFLRKSFIDTKKRNVVSTTNNRMIENPSFIRIKPATKLVMAGVKFRATYRDGNILDIHFQNGLFYIPHIDLDDFFISFLLNCVAFEQCYYYCPKDITIYVVFMGWLMNSSTDVSLLSEKKVLENYHGTDEELAKVFTNVGKYVFDIQRHYLLAVFWDVNEYCDNRWHVTFGGFMYTYFDNPWAAISAFAAFMLLSLAALQTFFTIFPN